MHENTAPLEQEEPCSSFACKSAWRAASLCCDSRPGPETLPEVVGNLQVNCEWSPLV